MSLPIIFLHKGNPDFLPYPLYKAKETNPNSRVILLGDASNNWLSNKPEVEFYDYRKYKQRAQTELVKYYKHMSTNPAEYELVCIARWFIISEFVRHNNIDKAFIADSDVLLYCDLEEERQKNFKTYRCTLTNNTSAGISFMNDMSVLEDYCNFVLDCYTLKDKFHFDKAKSHYESLKNNGKPGGVADLTFWGLMKQMCPCDFGETTMITNEYTTFDHCLRALHGYESEGSFKKIHFKRKHQHSNEIVPFCKNLRLDTYIKFNCLHMQGVDCKPLIKHYYEKTR